MLSCPMLLMIVTVNSEVHLGVRSTNSWICQSSELTTVLSSTTLISLHKIWNATELSATEAITPP